jgi:uncharacterized membrane protein
MNFKPRCPGNVTQVPLRLLSAFLLFAVAGAVEAKPPFLITFNDYYKPDPSSALGQAKCGICHTQPPTRNAYGKDLKKLVDASSDGNLTVDMLKQVESLDSDGDGYTNADEIIAGFLPGDPASHPSGSPGKATSVPAASTPSSSIIPSNGFHPIFIHFPIALFLFGVFLEFVGIRKKNSALGVGAVWNLHAALASLLIVIPTGVAAWLIGGHKLEGAMLFHLISAVSSALLMTGSIFVRKKVGNEDKGYWVLLILAAAAISATGYFGGQMVYG